MKLFDSVKVRGMVLRNRILMAPMLTNLGYKSKRGRAYFVARAKGGVGAIVAYGIPPDLLINDQAWEQKDQRQSFIEGIRELTEEVHNLGAKIGIQLWHGNRFPAIIGGNFDRGEWVAPSARIEGNPPHSMVSVSARLREMTTQEIESLIQSYSRAAAQAKEAGFDFVEFHGAHSYLANQFFSPADNHRTDKYGGNLAGRMRFGIDCIQAIRGAVGEDYPIFYRFPAEEARPGGITLSESIEYAVELEKAGVDVLNVSTGTSNDRRGLDYHITPPYERPALFIPVAKSILVLQTGLARPNDSADRRLQGKFVRFPGHIHVKLLSSDILPSIPSTMLIHQPEIHQFEGKVIVSARVETTKRVPGLPERLWFSFPEQYTAWISERSDGFASSLLQLAMYIEEDLEVRGSISPRLVYGLQEYQQVFHSWFPSQFAKINIYYDRLEAARPNPGASAVVTAFSGGVDSFHTLWCHLPENQPIPTAQISYGLFVHGFDVPLTDEAFYKQAADQYNALFQRLGMNLLTASTNAHSFWQYRVRWEYVNGGSLIGVAHVLTNLLCRYYVPSTLSYSDHTPLGNSPLVDHLLSTETIEVMHFGGDQERIEKLTMINSWEEARRLLRVCTDISNQVGIENCSRCIKCKYTYTMLDALGMAANFPSIHKGFRYWDILKWGFIPIRPVYFKQMMRRTLKPLRLDIMLPLLIALLVGSLRSALYWKVINRIPKTSLYRLKHYLFAPKR